MYSSVIKCETEGQVLLEVRAMVDFGLKFSAAVAHFYAGFSTLTVQRFGGKIFHPSPSFKIVLELCSHLSFHVCYLLVSPSHVSRLSVSPSPVPSRLFRAAGERYRRECLAHGGGVPAHQIVSALLTCDVMADQLAESVVTDVIRQRR